MKNIAYSAIFQGDTVIVSAGLFVFVGILLTVGFILLRIQISYCPLFPNPPFSDG
jgi:hypothetical protein